MNLAKEALHVLTSIAPTAATALGGPFAGVAVSAIENALGVTQQPTDQREAAVNQALLSGDPETLLKFKQADNDMEATMAKLGIQKDDLVYKDIDSARQMHEKTNDPTPRQLSWVLVIGFTIMCLMMMGACALGYADKMGKEAFGLVMMILGWYAKGASQAETFWFGSSLGSKNKDAALAEIAKS